MNFLAEVLHSAEKIEIEEINQKVPELKQKIDLLKHDLVQYTDNVYIKYSTLARPKKNRKLLDRAKSLEEEIKTLRKNGENAIKKELLKSDEKLTEHIQALETIDFTLHILSLICKTNEKYEEFVSSLQENQFYKCKKIISELETIIGDIPDDEELLVIDELRSCLGEKNNLLLNKIRQCFQEKIITAKEGNISSLKILSDFHPLGEALLAMFYNESAVYTLSEFAKFLWDNFFVPIVDNIVEVKIDTNSDYSMISIKLIDITKKSCYKETFLHINMVLEFLQANFNFPLADLESSLTTLDMIGLDLRDNLSELIIKHCLVDTIPSTVEGLKQYQVVIVETEKLEAALRNSKFFSTETRALLDYASNIDFHFINKKCEQHMLHSEQIMKKDLHDMIEVEEPYSPENSFGTELEEFSQCSVSKSVRELLGYCEEILQQALKGSDMSAGRLLTTCQNILRKYTTFVPEYHSKLLKTIPQQVALFHNNCFYIAYNLKNWNVAYLSKMPPTLNLIIKSFEHEIDLLTQVASDTFSDFVKSEIKKINEIMKDSGLDEIMLEDLKPITEKCVRQCVRQQELLKTVWHKVLSYKIYNKTLGIILNTLCSCLINSVINLQDISCKSTEQLVNVINIVISRGPKLFTDPKEVSLYVNLWFKLNELNYVLGASLVDINERWADGKGPLSVFKPVELKSLIKALFQNTDRRAAILLKIQ